MAKQNVIIYYKDKDVYAFSTNEQITVLFEAQRKLSGFYKKTIKMNDLQFKSFSYLYRDSMLHMDVLTDGNHSFDFIMTYEESRRLEEKCDQIYDKILKLERELITMPFDESHRELVSDFILVRRKASENVMGVYNTFNIAVELFRDSIL